MIDFSKRVTTSFGVSIGTGLMLESLFIPTEDRYDVKREIPNKVNVEDYNFHLINLLTLSRNIITSFEIKIDSSLILKDKNFLECLRNEVMIIENLYTGKTAKPVFYFNDIKKLSERINAGKGETDTGPVSLNKSIHLALDKLNLKKEIESSYPVLENVIRLPKIPGPKKNIITTHISLDLLTENKIELLDSHTGVLSNKDKFYKKYNNIGSKDMSVFPFNEILIYLIGDKSLSKIISTKVRFMLHDLAVVNKWNQKTDVNTVTRQIRKEQDIAVFLKSYKPIY